MKLENQVCSLELAKKLKKLGVKQESLWYWVKDKKDKDIKSNYELWAGDTLKPWEVDEVHYSGYTVAELGEILKEVDERIPWYANGSWWAWGISENNPDIKAKTEANARATMLIYLLENKLIQ